MEAYLWRPSVCATIEEFSGASSVSFSVITSLWSHLVTLEAPLPTDIYTKKRWSTTQMRGEGPHVMAPAEANIESVFLMGCVFLDLQGWQASSLLGSFRRRSMAKHFAFAKRHYSDWKEWAAHRDAQDTLRHVPCISSRRQGYE